MKKFWITAAAVVITIFIIVSFTTRPDVQIIRSDSGKDYASEFVKDLADMDNRKGIRMYVEDEEISFPEQNPYMSSKGSLMFPIDLLTDTFNCSTQVYDSGNILIEKGTNSISLYVNSASARINGTIIEMSDKVQSDQGRLYVPIQDIAEYINYYFSMDYSQANAAMEQITEEVKLPERYDMRELGRVTPIRNQGLYGTCWAFASLAALETTLTPTENLVFSPDHMTLSNSFRLTQNDGGEYTMAIAYMASWQGPVYESDDPYGDGETTDQVPARRHLEEAQIIAAKDYEGIKQAIYKYGAVETSIYTQMTTANTYSKYYNQEQAAYYYDQEATCNHDIIIVGWDDYYPRSAFTILPEHDGAFICKNSWGTEFGEDGYFYVSYEDVNIGKTNVVYSKLGPADNFDHIYQSDLLGWTGLLGYGREDAYFANVYTAGENEELAAVSFYATDNSTKYKIFVVPEFNGVESLNSREFVKEGAFENAGYYTVRLDEAVPLNDHVDYAIVVYIETPGSIHPIAIEYDADERTKEFDIKDGEGYISLYGRNWASAEKEKTCNLCMKAFTNNISKSATKH